MIERTRQESVSAAEKCQQDVKNAPWCQNILVFAQTRAGRKYKSDIAAIRGAMVEKTM